MLTEQLAVRTGAGLRFMAYADSCADMGNTQSHSQSPIWILDVDRCASIVERRLFSMLGCSALILVLCHIFTAHVTSDSSQIISFSVQLFFRLEISHSHYVTTSILSRT